MSHKTPNFCLLLKSQEMCGKSGPATPQSRSCPKLRCSRRLPTSQWTWTCARQSAAILSPPHPLPRPLLHLLNSPADVQELELFLPIWKNKLVERERNMTKGKKKMGSGGPYRCAMVPKGLGQPWGGQEELFQRMRRSETTSLEGQVSHLRRREMLGPFITLFSPLCEEKRSRVKHMSLLT